MQIYGKEIFSVPLGGSEIKRCLCDFYVIDGNHDFIIEVEYYPKEKLYDSEFENEVMHRDYLFWCDEKGKNFTIYIMPMQNPVEQIKIVWH